MKKGMLFLFLGLLLTSCGTSSRLGKDVKTEHLPAPPGTIELAENAFFDMTEVTNFHWLEYLFWIGRTYGKNSAEYQSMLPDTTVWIKLDSSYRGHEAFYLRHRAYFDYPVVGISYEQAVQYCNWRSDRVMEYMLIKRKVIPWRVDAPADSAFTIEKYFRGAYYGVQPDPHLMVYPHYSLPDSLTYRKAIVFADSLNAKNIRSCRKKHCNMDQYLGRLCPENRPDRSQYPYSPDPTMGVDCDYCRKDLIFHLKGNVREWTDLPGVVFGASFLDSCTLVPDYLFRKNAHSVNSYTGFRAKCEYRRWKN